VAEQVLMSPVEVIGPDGLIGAAEATFHLDGDPVDSSWRGSLHGLVLPGRAVVALRLPDGTEGAISHMRFVGHEPVEDPEFQGDGPPPVGDTTATTSAASAHPRSEPRAVQDGVRPHRAGSESGSTPRKARSGHGGGVDSGSHHL
jgi:hypothetical protein